MASMLGITLTLSLVLIPTNAFLVPCRQLLLSPFNVTLKPPLDISLRSPLFPKNTSQMIWLSALRSAPAPKGAVQTAIEEKVGLNVVVVVFELKYLPVFACISSAEECNSTVKLCMCGLDL